MAIKTGNTDNIKLIEGLTVAAECFGSAVIFMSLFGNVKYLILICYMNTAIELFKITHFSILNFFSDKVLQKLGYGYTFTLCLVSYAIRLGLVSVVPTPWWIIAIEFLMIGPSFALSHATIMMFVNGISSSGISISVQGIVGGLKDGFGKFFYVILY